MKKIVIAGCGELGSRFLQAAVGVPEVTAIDIVEPGEKARQVAKERMLQVSRTGPAPEVNWFNEPKDLHDTGALAIIATQADVRLGVFKELLSKGYKYFLAEKIVTQSDSDYREMIRLSDEAGAKVWVNCKTRNYPVWQYVKSKIAEGETLTYHSAGGNHGLCTNGLHTMDLFVFLASAASLEAGATRFDPQPYLTKRGKYDVSGWMEVRSGKSVLLMQYEGSHAQMPVDLLFTEKYRWMVDNSTRQAFESSADQKQWTPIPFEGDVSVSAMSRGFIADILANGSCELPTLADCYPAHKAMFDMLVPYFNKALNKNDDTCPVT